MSVPNHIASVTLPLEVHHWTLESAEKTNVVKRRNSDFTQVSCTTLAKEDSQTINQQCGRKGRTHEASSL